MSNSLRPYAGQRASAQLGSVPLRELREFIEDAVPEAKVDSLHEPDRMSIIFRVDRKSTRLNSSHTVISYAVICLKKKKEKRIFMTAA